MGQSDRLSLLRDEIDELNPDHAVLIGRFDRDAIECITLPSASLAINLFFFRDALPIISRKVIDISESSQLPPHDYFGASKDANGGIEYLRVFDLAYFFTVNELAIGSIFFCNTSHSLASPSSLIVETTCEKDLQYCEYSFSLETRYEHEDTVILTEPGKEFCFPIDNLGDSFTCSVTEDKFVLRSNGATRQSFSNLSALCILAACAWDSFLYVNRKPLSSGLLISGEQVDFIGTQGNFLETLHQKAELFRHRPRGGIVRLYIEELGYPQIVRSISGLQTDHAVSLFANLMREDFSRPHQVLWVVAATEALLSDDNMRPNNIEKHWHPKASARERKKSEWSNARGNQMALRDRLLSYFYWFKENYPELLNEGGREGLKLFRFFDSVESLHAQVKAAVDLRNQAGHLNLVQDPFEEASFETRVSYSNLPMQLRVMAVAYCMQSQSTNRNAVVAACKNILQGTY